MYEEHIKSCTYCRNNDRNSKLAELGHMIKGTKAASSVITTRSYSSPNSNPNTKDQLKKAKLKELGGMIRDYLD